MVLSPDWSKYGGGPNSDVASVFSDSLPGVGSYGLIA